jgi:acylphosphatase
MTMGYETMRSVRLTITGRVQGVGYRMWAERTAATLGISGWVRNRRDGSVELQASGDDAAITALIDACWSGPRHAEVTAVMVADAEDDGSTGFSTRPTV